MASKTILPTTQIKNKTKHLSLMVLILYKVVLAVDKALVNGHGLFS